MSAAATGWEYHTIDLPPTDRESLSRLGAAGWELVAVLPTALPAVHTLYLKRPAPDLRQRVTLDQRRAFFAEQGIADPLPRPGDDR